MTENEAIDKLKNMRLFMQIEDNKNECKFTEDDYAANKMALQALEEVQQYREIGTVEECRDAVERLKAKRPDGGMDIDGKDYLICPNCCAIVADGEWTAKFCPDCGQKLDWRGEE